MNGKPNNLIFIYGSLRKGCYNNRMIDTQEFVCRATIKGYKMFKHIMLPYPKVIKTDSSADMIQGEVWKVTDSVFEKIDMMEKGAGFYRDTVIFDYMECSIWLFDTQEIAEIYNEVIELEKGNWLEEVIGR